MGLHRTLEYFPNHSPQRNIVLKHIETLQDCANGKSFPLVIKIEDPSSQSFISLIPNSPYDSMEEDPQIQITKTPHTWEQICELVTFR